MMIDARLLPPENVLETEVCVVGTGPAGIALAREFANQNFRVVLLESGNLDLPDPNTQSLAKVDTETDFVQVTADNRNRRFGGNSSYWAIKIGRGQVGLRHRPLDEVDFEKRDGLPYSGWCFSKDYLNPYYDRAQEFFQMGPFAYDAEDWQDSQNLPLPFLDDRVKTRIFQFSPGKVVFETRRDEINHSSTITTYLNANVTRLETDETGQTVTRAKVDCLNGNRFWVSAKIFVLAVGGVEAARLLLLSNQTQKNGLGNQHDLVGRFFMDHPLVFGGMFVPANPQLFNSTALYDMREVGDSTIMGALALSDETIRREQLPNISFHLFPRPKRLLPSNAIASMKALATLQGIKEGPTKTLQHLSNVVTGLGDVTTSIYDKLKKTPQPLWTNFSTGGWSSLQEDREKVYGSFEVLHQTEQFPHPDNRVVLSEKCDQLGNRRAKLQTRWRDSEIQGIRRAQKILAEEIERAGLGHFQIYSNEGLPVLDTPGTSHHMGTTRMHNDPKQGVVDENCQVYGVSNLFIASSSVFPTGGYANPTLTIVALAIRLADRIKTLVEQPILLEKTRI